MKNSFKKYLMGFSLSTVVAICVHFRTTAIERMAPIELTEDQKARVLPENDSVRELMRMKSGMYAPPRAVSKNEPFLLKLEKVAYASPVILFSTLLSPSFLPALAYPGQFRNAHGRRLPLAFSVPDGIGAAAQAEGFGWGAVQGIVFYLPFFVGRRRKGQRGIHFPSESAPSQQSSDETTTARERSALDSAINKCDE